jgi:hypothetical protein
MAPYELINNAESNLQEWLETQPPACTNTVSEQMELHELTFLCACKRHKIKKQ